MAKINQILEWHRYNHLNFEPAYQRKGGIWSEKDKQMLIDTILKDLPIPELFLYHRSLSGGGFAYDVVDGKQRLMTIIEFSENKFRIPVDINEETEKFLFKELPPDLQDRFYNYDMRFFEIKNLGIEVMFDIFVRINRTGRILSKQEIRNAVFRGDFINLARKLCEEGRLKNYFLKRKIVSKSSQKRMGDVELMLELLAYLQNGVQDKKKTLDKIIGENEKLRSKTIIRRRAIRILSLINSILPNIETTRFHQKSDFYSLFAVIADLDNEGYNIENPNYQKTARLVLLSLSNAIDLYKEKEKSKNEDIIRYYKTTQEGTDTKTNRTIRIDYLKSILSSVIGKKDKRRLFSPEQKRLLWNTSRGRKCGICGRFIHDWDELEVDHKKLWSLGGPTDLENGQLAHADCNRRKLKKLPK